MMKGKIIFAVDFDGTLCEEKWPLIGAPNKKLIDYLIRRRKYGDVVILSTCREGTKLGEAIEWCYEHGLEFDAVNENCEEIKKAWGGDYRKIYADYYIDDHNMTTQKLSGIGCKLPFH